MSPRFDFLDRLHGLVCLYKPADVGLNYLAWAFANKLSTALNAADQHRPANYLEIESNEKTVSLNIRPSYLDNRLAVGPKYQPHDIPVAITPIGSRTSGVCVAGINNGIRYVNQLKKQKPIKVLHVKGKLGEATRFLYKDEKVVAKAKYQALKRSTIDNMLSAFQAAHQRKIFVELGVDIQSQKAYDLAVEGLLRPLKSNIPSIYSVKCIDFNSPDFTLEIICVNENENYLLQFIHDLGLNMKTLAHCTGIRCIRYGLFTVPHSLLLKECTLENVKMNMKLCKKLMIEGKTYGSPHLQLVPEKISSGQASYERSETS